MPIRTRSGEWLTTRRHKGRSEVNAVAADARLRALHEREWAWRRREFAGADDEDNLAEPAAHLPRVDAATQAARGDYWRAALSELEAIPHRELSAQAQVDAQVFAAQLHERLDDLRFRVHELPFNSDTAFWSNLGFTARRPFQDCDDAERYLGILADIPRYFTEHIENMRAGLARGFSLPRTVMAGPLSSLAEVLKPQAIEDNLFFTPFHLLPASIDAASAASLRERATRLIRDAVLPAWRDLEAFIGGQYAAQARSTLAARDMPDGAAYYRMCIRKYVTADMTPEAIHAIGTAEVADIRARMQEAMTDAGFTGSLPEFFDFLRCDPQFQARSAEELLMHAAWIMKRVDGVIGRFIGHLPRTPIALHPVPDELAPHYTSGRGGPGLYLLNTHNLPIRPLYTLPALTLHEASPGHGMQMALAAELDHLPEFRRHTHLSAYTEGWALYCEWLGQEMGLYRTAHERFGMLVFQMWRACRLVVDTGLHHFGWSREQAVSYMLENTSLSPQEIAGEVDRYIAWPAQALSYHLGQIAIRNARARAEKVLGSRFDLRAFHDIVLALGSVPLPVLDAQVDAWLQSLAG